MEIELVPGPGDPVETVVVARAVAAAGLVLGVGSAGPGRIGRPPVVAGRDRRSGGPGVP